MSKCEWKGCEAEATQCPRFRFYASASYGPHLPIEVMLKLKLCAEHCKQTAAVKDDFLDHQLWDKVMDVCRQLDRADPCRERTELDFVPIVTMEKSFAKHNPV